MQQLDAKLAAQEDKLLACVHCGLCLEACPTYVATGDENDSPRGRIYLMRAVQEGQLASDSIAFERHIDRCLGCRACEPVCPAGVEYGQLLEAGRAELLESGAKRGFIYRLIRLALRHVWLHPARLKFVFWCARIARDAGIARVLLKSRGAHFVSGRLEFALALLESSAPRAIAGKGGRRSLTKDQTKSAQATLQETKSDVTTAAHSVLLFTGCVAEGLFRRINQATARVLQANGFAVRAPREQVCCGALHAHAGDLDGARKLARQNIQAFNALEEPIVTNAGGCGAMLSTYDHLLADDEQFAERACRFSARVRDVSQQLAAINVRQGVAMGQERVTYDASCHLLYGQHAGNAPLEVLKNIPELNLVPLSGSDRCCGGAGVYNLLERELSGRVLAEKLAYVMQTRAEILATGNPGCQMHIGAGAMLEGMKLRVCHPIELLDESYRRAGIYWTSDK